MKKSLLSALALSLSLTGLAQAHDAWLAPQDGNWAVVYGHKAGFEPYANDKVKQVQAVDAQGKALQVQRQDSDKGVVLSFAGEPALATLVFDNGYWSKAPGGKTINVAKDENKGATHGTHPVKYHKYIMDWSAQAGRPAGQEAEILALNAQAPKAGEKVEVQVLYQGRPAAGWAVGIDDSEDSPLRTDAQGKAFFDVTPGRNFISASHRVPVQGDPKTDENSISVNLIFNAGQ